MSGIGIALSVVMRCVCRFVYASLSLIQFELITSLSLSSLLLWVWVGVVFFCVFFCFVFNIGRGLYTYDLVVLVLPY